MTIHCSFCGRNPDESICIIAAEEAWICDVCAGIAYARVREHIELQNDMAERRAEVSQWTEFAP